MSKRKHEQSIDTQSEQANLFTSTPIHDRSSTFTAIFSPTTGTPRSLQRHPPFDSASHKILAWRKASSQRSLSNSFSNAASKVNSGAVESHGESKDVVYETHSDDDGEKYAGKKLEKVLIDMDVVGTLVVARWYGGVLLGPVRFKWIEDAAQEAIRKWKASRGDAGVKKVKTNEARAGDETVQKQRLTKVLSERDTSVNVLRGLLAEKNAELNKLEETAGNGDTLKTDKQEAAYSSPTKAAPDYTSMPLQRLIQMEKARDATLSWVLKQIDAAEEKLKAQRSKKVD